MEILSPETIRSSDGEVDEQGDSENEVEEVEDSEKSPKVPDVLPMVMDEMEWNSLINSKRMGAWHEAQKNAEQQQVCCPLYDCGITDDFFSVNFVRKAATSALAKPVRTVASACIARNGNNLVQLR